jgi:opacity protein-like surface antigen
MKTTTFTKLAAAAICSVSLVSTSFAAEISSDDKKIYFGVEGGYSVAAKSKFKDKDADDNLVIGKLKGTGVYEGKIGYKFYPGLAIELAYAYRPKYRLNVWFPDKPDVGTVNTISQANVQSHTLMLNLMYEAQTEKAYRPYFLFGLGYAHVTPKRSPIFADIPAPVAAGYYNGNTRPQIGSIKKFTSERLGWRIGTGIVYDVTPNFSLVGGVKLEVINNIGLHAEFTDPAGKVIKKSSLKKTIGVADLTLGARMSL